MERNLIGELNIMKETGIRPNFSEVGRRYGVDRHTVAKYWNGGGPQPRDGRAGRASAFDALRDEIEGRAQLPGVTAKGVHEWLLDRHADADPPLPGYNAFTHWLGTPSISHCADIGYRPAFADIAATSGRTSARPFLKPPPPS